MVGMKDFTSLGSTLKLTQGLLQQEPWACQDCAGRSFPTLTEMWAQWMPAQLLMDEFSS